MKSTAKVADPAPALGAYRITFNPRSKWLPHNCITVVGCESAEDARKKLHELLDHAIVQIEKGR